MFILAALIYTFYVKVQTAIHIFIKEYAVESAHDYNFTIGPVDPEICAAQISQYPEKRGKPNVGLKISGLKFKLLVFNSL